MRAPSGSVISRRTRSARERSIEYAEFLSDGPMLSQPASRTAQARAARTRRRREIMRASVATGARTVALAARQRASRRELQRADRAERLLERLEAIRVDRRAHGLLHDLQCDRR